MSSGAPLHPPPPPLVYQDGVPPYHNAHTGATGGAPGPSPPGASGGGAVLPHRSRREATLPAPQYDDQHHPRAAPSSTLSSLSASSACSGRVEGRRGAAAPAGAPPKTARSATSASSSSSSSSADDSTRASTASTASLLSSPTAASRHRQHTPPPPPSPPPALPHTPASASGAPSPARSPSAPLTRALMDVRDAGEVMRVVGGGAVAGAASEAVSLPTLVAQQRDRIYALVQERDGARAELQELHELFQRLHDDYDAATQEAAAQQLRLSSLRSEHEAQSEEMRLLRASHARQQQRIQAFEEEWLERSKHLRDQLDAAVLERDAVQAQRDACMHDSADVRRQLLQLQAELHRSDAAHRDALRVQADAHAQELRTALQETEAQLQTRADATRREARLVQQSLHELDAGHGAASEERETLRWRLAETEAVAHKKELLRAELERTVQQLRARLAEAEEAARQDAHRQTQRAEEMERLYRSQVTHEQQRAQTLLDDLAAARRATQEALRQHEALQQRHSEEVAEAAARSAQREEVWRQQLHRLRAELDDAQARALRHEATAQRRQRELEALSATSHSTQESHEKLQHAHTAQSQQLSRAEGSVRVLQAQLREKEREAELLRCAMEQATWTREMRQAAQHTLASLLGVPRVSVLGRGGLGIRARHVRRAAVDGDSGSDADSDGNAATAATLELVDADAPTHGEEGDSADVRVGAGAGAAQALQLEWAAAPSHPAAPAAAAAGVKSHKATPHRTASAVLSSPAGAPAAAAATAPSVAPPPPPPPPDTEAATLHVAAAAGANTTTRPPPPRETAVQSSVALDAGGAPRAESIERTLPRDGTAAVRDGEAEERQRWAATSAAAPNPHHPHPHHPHPFLHPSPHGPQFSATPSTPAAAPPLHPGTPRVGAPLHRSTAGAHASPFRLLAYTPTRGGGLGAPTTTAAAAAAAGSPTSVAGLPATPRGEGGPRPFTSPLRPRPSAGHAYNLPDPREDGPLPHEGLVASASAAAAAAAAAVRGHSTPSAGVTGAAAHPRATASTGGHVDVYFDDFLGPSSARRGLTPARHVAATSASAALDPVNSDPRTLSSQPPDGHGQARGRATEDSASAVSSTPRFVLRPHTSAAAAPGVRAAQLLATLPHHAPRDEPHGNRSRSRHSSDHGVGGGTTARGSDDAALQQYLHDMVQQVLSSRGGSGVEAPDRARAGRPSAGNVTVDVDDDFGSASRPRSVLAVPAQGTAAAPPTSIREPAAHSRAAANTTAPARRATAAAPQTAARTHAGSPGGVAATLQQLAERQQHLLQSLAAPPSGDALGAQLQRLLHGDAWSDLGAAYDEAASLARQAAPRSASAGGASHLTASTGADDASSVSMRRREAATDDVLHGAAHDPRARMQREDEALEVELDPRQLSYSTTVNTATTQYSAIPTPVQRGIGSAAAAAALLTRSVGEEGGDRRHAGAASARAPHGTMSELPHSALPEAESMRGSHTPSDVPSARSVPSVSAVSSLTQLGRRLAAPFA